MEAVLDAAGPAHHSNLLVGTKIECLHRLLLFIFQNDERKLTKAALGGAGRSKSGEGREYRPGRTCFRVALLAASVIGLIGLVMLVHPRTQTMVYQSANKLGTMLPATYSRQQMMNR